MKSKEEIRPEKIINPETIFRTLKNQILFYSNLGIPDCIVQDLAKALEELYEKNFN